MSLPQTLHHRAADYFKELQDRVCGGLSKVDGHSFQEDNWTREGGGGGRTRVLAAGHVFEKAGVNFSDVSGQFSPEFAAHIPGEGLDFTATGVSLVLHPRNPYVPTVHMNVRMLAATPAGGDTVSWFGGGMDLTPYYGFEEDAVHFHATCRDALVPFGTEHYPRFKRWCDSYFHLKHRQEPRGIGGIFFDDLSAPDFDTAFSLTRSVGDHFLSAYLPIVQRRRDTAYGERERDFQAYRRGRYVEFNLVWDRGTHFGLQSGGRTESILLSMPPLVSWSYQHAAPAGSVEAALTRDFLVRREWV